MTMTEQLDKLRETALASMPPDAVRINHDFTEKLAASGIVEKAKTVGDMAPRFALRNAEGDTVHSDDLLSRGPLVLTFYRGNW